MKGAYITWKTQLSLETKNALEAKTGIYTLFRTSLASYVEELVVQQTLGVCTKFNSNIGVPIHVITYCRDSQLVVIGLVWSQDKNGAECQDVKSFMWTDTENRYLYCQLFLWGQEEKNVPATPASPHFFSSISLCLCLFCHFIHNTRIHSPVPRRGTLDESRDSVSTLCCKKHCFSPWFSLSCLCVV